MAQSRVCPPPPSKLEKLTQYHRQLSQISSIHRIIPYNDSRALFRAFCGRTPSDPNYPYEPTPCKCGIETCTSAHLITSCQLLDHTRSIKLKNYLGAINPHTIFQEPSNAKLMLGFLKSTRIGYHSTINYDPIISPPEPECEPFAIPVFT
jgi:hypothetical protein